MKRRHYITYLFFTLPALAALVFLLIIADRSRSTLHDYPVRPGTDEWGSYLHTIMKLRGDKINNYIVLSCIEICLKNDDFYKKLSPDKQKEFDSLKLVCIWHK